MGVRARLDRRVTRGFPRGSPFLKAAVCQSGRGRLFFFSPNHAEVPSARDLQSARLTIVPSRLRRLSTWPTKVRFPPSCAITAPAWSRYASDLPHVLGVPSALFGSNVPLQTSGQQRRAPSAPALDPRLPMRAPRSPIISRRPSRDLRRASTLRARSRALPLEIIRNARPTLARRWFRSTRDATLASRESPRARDPSS